MSDQKYHLDILQAESFYPCPQVTHGCEQWVRLEEGDQVFLRCCNRSSDPVVVRVSVDGTSTGCVSMIFPTSRTVIGLFKGDILTHKSILIKSVRKREEKPLSAAGCDSGRFVVEWLECFDSAPQTTDDDCDFQRAPLRTDDAHGHNKETDCVRAADGDKLAKERGSWSKTPFKTGSVLHRSCIRYTDEFGFQVRKIPLPEASRKRSREEEQGPEAKTEAKPEAKTEAKRKAKPEAKREAKREAKLEVIDLTGED